VGVPGARVTTFGGSAWRLEATFPFRIPFLSILPLLGGPVLPFPSPFFIPFPTPSPHPTATPPALNASLRRHSEQCTNGNYAYGQEQGNGGG
jgi:hypothetical protein